MIAVTFFCIYSHVRASETSLVFMKKADDWGRMFSYVEMIATLFPNWSDYNLLKKASNDFYNSIKVREHKYDMKLFIILN